LLLLLLLLLWLVVAHGHIRKVVEEVSLWCLLLLLLLLLWLGRGSSSLCLLFRLFLFDLFAATNVRG
jgi:hypothetical protein